MGEEYIRRIMVLGLVPSFGPVILFDDTEDLLKWAATGTGADFVCEKSQSYVYNKDYGLHLATKVTTPADGDLVSGYRYIFSRPGKRYRLELLFLFPSATDPEWVGCQVNINDGAYLHKCGLRWHPVAERWYYLKSDDTWAHVTGLTKSPYHGKWHRLVMEWDQSAVKYVKAVCDSDEADISDLVYRKESAVGSIGADVFLYVEAAGAAQAHCYFDDVLVMEV